MAGNLLETGTLFDYKDFDFTKRIKKDKVLADAPLQVGEQDIPDRDNRYIEKTFDDED